MNPSPGIDIDPFLSQLTQLGEAFRELEERLSTLSASLERLSTQLADIDPDPDLNPPTTETP
jgi:hypothetical protein